MMTRGSLIALALLPVVAGCGGFNAEYDCEQMAACEGVTSEQALDLCIDLAEALYDNLSSEDMETLDEIFEQCRDLKGCEYEECGRDLANQVSPSGS